jgi:hypothetical protein
MDMEDIAVRRCAHLLCLLAWVIGCSPETEINTTGVLARCDYTNGFTGDVECKEYLGSNWSINAMRADCDAPVPGSDPGDLIEEEPCERSAIKGVCAVEPATVEAANIVFSSASESTCSDLSLGCFFAGGEWLPEPSCDD